MALRNLPVPVTSYRNEVVRKMPEIASFFKDLGFMEANIKVKDDRVLVHGKMKNGKNILIDMLENDVYSEKTVAVSKKMNLDRRVVEAKKLRKKGLTQSEIANRLGVSQKTISSDLNR